VLASIFSGRSECFHDRFAQLAELEIGEAASPRPGFDLSNPQQRAEGGQNIVHSAHGIFDSRGLGLYREISDVLQAVTEVRQGGLRRLSVSVTDDQTH
jgi:hypothetical protein